MTQLACADVGKFGGKARQLVEGESLVHPVLPMKEISNELDLHMI